MPRLGNSLRNRPKAIIFDIGRVIVGVSMGRGFALLGLPAGRTPEQLWKALEPTSQWLAWQEGRLSPSEFHRHICKLIGSQISFEQFRESWNAMLDPVALLPNSLFDRLAPRFRLALLSNTDLIHSAHLEATCSFVRYFPVRVYSCDVGSSKPAHAIYQHTLRELQVSPSEALFIDDVYENADAAARLGIPSIHYTSPTELFAELAQI